MKNLQKPTCINILSSLKYWYCGWSRNTLLMTVKPRKYIQVGVRSTEFTLADCPTMDDRSEMNLKSSGRLKQERKTNSSFY